MNLTKLMAGLMLEGARSADELHKAIDDAVDLIETTPTLAHSEQLSEVAS